MNLKRSLKALGGVVIGAALCVCSPLDQACAQKNPVSNQLYTWTDDKGVTHFSSAKPSVPTSSDRGSVGESSAKSVPRKAELPPIMRGELKIPQPQAVGCAPHGGIDCSAGSDADGSVICADGFREASARFRFNCSAARLEVADILVDKNESSISAFVRNRSQIEAQQVKVALEFEGELIHLAGSGSIESFGLERYQAAVNLEQVGFTPPKRAVKVSCANCK